MPTASSIVARSRHLYVAHLEDDIADLQRWVGSLDVVVQTCAAHDHSSFRTILEAFSRPAEILFFGAHGSAKPAHDTRLLIEGAEPYAVDLIPTFGCSRLHGGDLKFMPPRTRSTPPNWLADQPLGAESLWLDLYTTQMSPASGLVLADLSAMAIVSGSVQILDLAAAEIAGATFRQCVAAGRRILELRSRLRTLTSALSAKWRAMRRPRFCSQTVLRQECWYLPHGSHPPHDAPFVFSALTNIRSGGAVLART